MKRSASLAVMAAYGLFATVSVSPVLAAQLGANGLTMYASKWTLRAANLTLSTVHNAIVHHYVVYRDIVHHY